MIVAVGCPPRSGATVLGLMLARCRGAAFVGEARWLWRRWASASHLCGCGLTFAGCPFWTAVVGRAFGGWAGADPAEAIRLEERILRWRRIPALAGWSRPPELAQALDRYAALLRPLYGAILETAGAAAVVDTTGDPLYGLALAHAFPADLRHVHLVRDSRGVVYSRSTVVARADRVDGPSTLLQGSARAVALDWSAHHLGLELLSQRVPSVRVRYETLAGEPARALGPVLALCGLEASADLAEELAAHRLDLPVHHSAAGNPMQFRQGSIEVRVDERWREHLSRGDRAVSLGLTAPLLLRYGYRP